MIYYMIVSDLFQEEVIFYTAWKEKSTSSADLTRVNSGSFRGKIKILPLFKTI